MSVFKVVPIILVMGGISIGLPFIPKKKKDILLDKDRWVVSGIVAELVHRAINDARQSGLPIGILVAHPTCRFKYWLLDVKKNVATVASREDGKKKKFPYDELFSLGVVMRYADQEGIKTHLKRLEQYESN